MPLPEIECSFLARLADAPAVGTACGPVVALLTEFFGDGFDRTLVPDGFCLFQPAGAKPEQIRTVLVAHMDEIGGCVYCEQPDANGAFACRFWGTTDPALYADAELVAMDYLDEAAQPDVFPVRAEIAGAGQLLIRSLSARPVRPYRTVFTFAGRAEFDERYIYAKAVDPRVTLYCVCDAVRRIADPSVAAVLVMAEECAMDVARKAVAFLWRNCPDLSLVINADVPALANLGEADLDMPAIRIFEGRNFIDPSFGICASEAMLERGIAMRLSSARSGSQTLLFSPLAPTLSIALPGDAIHSPRGKMSLLGAARCTELLTEIVRSAQPATTPSSPR